jgi:hypothetical protein
MIGRTGQYGVKRGTGIEERAAIVLACEDAAQTLSVQYWDANGQTTVKRYVGIAQTLTADCFTPGPMAG